MIKAGKIWSWLVARIRGSGSSRKSGPPVKGLPPIPSPKARTKSRYSIVIIDDSGRSRQIELTPLRIRIGLAVMASLVLVVGVGLFQLRGGAGDDVNSIRSERDALAEKVQMLQEKLKQAELAAAGNLTSQGPADGPQSTDTSDTAANSESGGGGSPSVAYGPSLTDGGQSSEDQGPSPGLSSGVPPLSSSGGMASDATPNAPDYGGDRALPARDPSAVASTGGEEPPAARRPREMIAFDTTQLTAVSERQNSGLLSFWLVKDRPDVHFAGYLFVFVEMVDKKGRSKIFVYPKKARVGEEYLPLDFKSGQVVSFERNLKVELPYKDRRPGVRLAGITILLYGENGDIVYQRGFHRAEVKHISGRAKKVDGRRPHRTRTRRAL